MNSMEIQKGIVDALFAELQKLDSQDLGKRISQMMDEQPHLMGFLFNLDEDFSENTHTYLLMCAIVIRDVFISAGIPIDVVDNATIEQIIEDRVKVFESLEESGKTLVDTEQAFSPVLLSSLKALNPELEEEGQDTSLILDVIIGLFEEAAASQENKEKKNA